MPPQFKLNTEYGKIAFMAKSALTGPRGLVVESANNFWGRLNLLLSHEMAIQFSGKVESRTVYAAPEDSEQGRAILREVIWDAATTRTQMVKDFRAEKVSSIFSPILFRRCVWIEIPWLLRALQRWEDQCIPLKMTIGLLPLTELYQVGIERGDRTMLQASWYNGMESEFVKLSAMWDLTWQEMTHFLQSSEIVTPEEDWEFYTPPVYQLL